jgi:hypothetical protein
VSAAVAVGVFARVVWCADSLSRSCRCSLMLRHLREVHLGLQSDFPFVVRDARVNFAQVRLPLVSGVVSPSRAGPICVSVRAGASAALIVVRRAFAVLQNVGQLQDELARCQNRVNDLESVVEKLQASVAESRADKVWRCRGVWATSWRMTHRASRDARMRAAPQESALELLEAERVRWSIELENARRMAPPSPSRLAASPRVRRPALLHARWAVVLSCCAAMTVQSATFRGGASDAGGDPIASAAHSGSQYRGGSEGPAGSGARSGSGATGKGWYCATYGTVHGCKSARACVCVCVCVPNNCVVAGAPSSQVSVAELVSTRTLTLKQLKEVIDAVYASKVKFDSKCLETRTPRETVRIAGHAALCTHRAIVADAVARRWSSTCTRT